MIAVSDEFSVNPPSPWIARFADQIEGDILDIACGSGRHTRLFLARGHRVTAIDRDLDAMADLRDCARLQMIEDDLETDGAAAPLPERGYGGVIVTNYLYRPLLPAIVAAVAPGGMLLYETFAVGNEAYGRPSNPDFLLRPGELIDAVAGRLQVAAFENGVIDAPRRAVVERICAVRGDARGVKLTG